MRPRKRFGQHWLRSETVLATITAGANLQPSDRVLEIGPGQGVLTRSLLPKVAQVVAVEIDRDLCQSLRQQWGQRPAFTLVEGDFLALYAAGLEKRGALWDAGGMVCNKVVANIPYNITGPILEALLGTIAAPRQPALETLVLLVQQEVAQRLCAKPGTKACGALTQRVRYLADCEILCAVPPSAFSPPPQVQSSVIRLQPRPFALVAQSPNHLQRLLQLGFSAKRKMLRNNLKAHIENDRLLSSLATVGLEPNVRAEDLSLEQWILLSNYLVEMSNDVCNLSAKIPGVS
jgi:16S rRNA (adenine1518-N6/adenine1519-N6)-dimethyltransferase